MPPGKQAPQGEAAAPMAASALLESMHRRVRLSRMAVWPVIVVGPIALAVAVASTPTTVAAAHATKSATARTRQPPPTRAAMRSCFWASGCAAARTSRRVRRHGLRTRWGLDP